MEFVFTLHSHLPWVLHHGRWPHGSDWICEAAVDCYLPLLETLLALEAEGVAAPVTLGVTPVLANQLAHPSFVQELEAFFDQRLEACVEAPDAFMRTGEKRLIPLAQFWQERYLRLRRLFHALDCDLLGAFRRLAEAGRLELISSAATHGFLPLLGEDESIRFQLDLGRREHIRLFGRAPTGCWVPECAYRPAGSWGPLPDARRRPRAGTESFLREAGFAYFFIDAHVADAGRSLGLYGETHPVDPTRRPQLEDALRPGRRSPYLPYRVTPVEGEPEVVALVRDPRSTLQVWSRYLGYPGDGAYLEFHKIRFPGGLKFWRVSGPGSDLGTKEPYDVNRARARAWRHGGHLAEVLGEIRNASATGGGELIVSPFDTELFGHWWFEGPQFLGDLYRSLHRQALVQPTTAGDRLARIPATDALALVEGSWGADGDFSMWMNPETEWTWRRLWALERRFWEVARSAIDDPARHGLLAQASRELLLAQASDWQFIISTGAAGDYATKRFTEHCDGLDTILRGFELGGLAWDDAVAAAEELAPRNDLFPDPLPSIRAALEGTPAASVA